MNNMEEKLKEIVFAHCSRLLLDKSILQTDAKFDEESLQHFIAELAQKKTKFKGAKMMMKDAIDMNIQQYGSLLNWFKSVEMNVGSQTLYCGIPTKMTERTRDELNTRYIKMLNAVLINIEKEKINKNNLEKENDEEIFKMGIIDIVKSKIEEIYGDEIQTKLMNNYREKFDNTAGGDDDNNSIIANFGRVTDNQDNDSNTIPNFSGDNDDDDSNTVPNFSDIDNNNDNEKYKSEEKYVNYDYLEDNKNVISDKVLKYNNNNQIINHDNMNSSKYLKREKKINLINCGQNNKNVYCLENAEGGTFNKFNQGTHFHGSNQFNGSVGHVENNYYYNNSADKPKISRNNNLFQYNPVDYLIGNGLSFWEDCTENALQKMHTLVSPQTAFHAFVWRYPVSSKLTNDRNMIIIAPLIKLLGDYFYFPASNLTFVTIRLMVYALTYCQDDLYFVTSRKVWDSSPTDNQSITISHQILEEFSKLWCSGYVDRLVKKQVFDKELIKEIVRQYQSILKKYKGAFECHYYKIYSKTSIKIPVVNTAFQAKEMEKEFGVYNNSKPVIPGDPSFSEYNNRIRQLNSKFVDQNHYITAKLEIQRY